MLYLTEEEVRKFLPMKDCINLMREAFSQLASGAALNQPRRRLILPTQSALHYMAAATPRYFGEKVYSTHPGAPAHFLFLLYRAEDAAPLALMEANYLGQIRTGAASGLATSLLARPDSRTVAIVGSGFQARSQLEAICAVRPIRTARVWSRSAANRERFAEEQSAKLGLRVEPAPTAEAAVSGADIVATATSAAEPVVRSEWVAAGTHINAVGSNQPRRRELFTELVRRADLIVSDSRDQARIESGDLLMSLANEEWTRVAELGDVVSGRAGRTRTEEITLFKSTGLAVEDVAAAGAVYERARSAGAGRAFYS